MLKQQSTQALASRDSATPVSRPLLTPREMMETLDGVVIGQKTSKTVLANSFYAHYLGKRAGISTPANRNVCFIAGPSGSGKTLMIKTLAESLGVPFLSFSAAELVPSGIIGLQIADVLERLYNLVGRNQEKANQAIILIDECDKLGTEGNYGGQAAQNILLTFLEGSRFQFPQPRAGEIGNQYSLDSSNFMIVVAGVCGNLAKVVQKRLKQGQATMGLRATSIAVSDEKVASEVLPDDVLQCGLSRELVGRCAHFSLNLPLTEEDLLHILTDSKISPIAEAREYFALHNIDLVIEEGAYRWIAQRALKLGTGGRALSNVLNLILREAKFEAPDFAGDQGTLRVTAEALEGGAPLCIAEVEVKAEVKSYFRIGKKKSEPQVLCENKAAQLRKDLVLPIPDAMSFGVGDPANPTIFIPPVEDKYVQYICRWTELNSGRIDETLESLLEKLDWDNTTGSARKWWEAFQNENKTRKPLVLRLAWELARREATVTEFFLAYVYSNTDNIAANLDYLSYTRLKKSEEQKRREAARLAAEAAKGDDEEVDFVDVV